MLRRTVDQWRQLFQAQHQSHLSAAEFCRQQGLCSKYFSACQKQLGWQAESRPAESVRTPFMPAVVSSRPSGIELHWQSAQLRLPTDVGPQWQARLLKVLV